MIRVRIVALTTIFALACGGATTPRPPTIEELRERARSAPNDPNAQYVLAEAELLLEGGDAIAAEAQIRRAMALAPDDLRLHYLAALERELHGHPSAALDGYLEVIRRASASDAPLAPALAEVAAAEIESLDDGARGYAERVEEALAPLHTAPGRLGEGARATIADVLIELAFRRGDLERVRALTDAQRCLTEWRVAGPFGPRHLLDFDRELPPETDDALADAYDYGAGRGTRETRTSHARGCAVNLGDGPVGGPGTTYAETTIALPEAGRSVLRVETPNAAQIWVDGRPLAKLDRRQEPLGRVSWHPIELDAGEHRVRVKLSTRHPNPILSASVSREPPPGEVEGQSLVAEHARIARAMSRGDMVGARQRLDPRLVRDGSPVFLVLGAAVSLADPQRSGSVRHDEARRLIGWAADRDAQAWYPRLTLARLDANEGRAQAAIATLQDATERWPELVVLPLQLVDLLEQRGWQAQVSDAIAAAREAVPDACRPIRAALEHARRRSRAAEELEHAEALVRCDARSDARVTTHLRRREWDAAAAELARLAALEPGEAPVSVLSAELNVARSRGDEARTMELVRELQARMPQAEGPITMEVDRTLARGDAQAARTRLRQAVVAEPDALIGQRRTLRAIGDEGPLATYRLDGAEVIRTLEASERTYREPMLLALDYSVYRVFEDGSMLELTHNIFRLQTQEAVDAMGELAVPENAQMLTMQTVKADGRRLEPDQIAGKETISFPSLSPGDYIEFEYLRTHNAPAGYPGGFVGDRYYFQNYETPFDRSELIVITPPDVELVVDPRGDAPVAEVQVEGDTRVHRWAVEESRPLVQEPGSIASRELIPSIAWGYRASWPIYVETLRDVLADRDPRDPAAERLVASILGSDAARTTIEQRAHQLYRWVLTHVEDSNDVFGMAPAMLAARTGNRARILRYLLELAGLDAELALARSYASDATRSSLPDDETYQNLLVRVRGDAPIWLHTAMRGAPFGYVPPVLAGMDALVLNEAAEQVEIAPRSLDADRRSIDADVTLAANGDGHLVVVETFHGAGAVMWREQLEEIPDAELESQFESAYVANLLGGGRLTRLMITGRENPEQPLVLRYEVDIGGLARRSGSGFHMTPLFRAQLVPQFAPVASRRTPQLVPAGLALDVVIRVHPPDGGAIVQTPPDARFEALGARAVLETERQGDALILRRHYRVPRMRVAPRDYPELARFARGADQAESAEVTLQM